MDVMIGAINLFRRYYDLGGLPLITRGIYSKLESELGLDDTSKDRTVIRLNGRDYVVSAGWTQKKWRQFERDVITPEVTRPMREILTPGDTMINVGAARGGTTLYAHSLVGESGAVYAFEPDTSQYEALIRNINHNGLQSVSCYNAAVGATAGKFHPREVVGQTTDEFEAEMDDTVAIDVLSLDRFIASNDIEPDLVKIDVDGAEQTVIEGAQESVLGQVPMVLELHDTNLLSNRTSVIELIFEAASEIRYLASQNPVVFDYHYGTRLSSPADLRRDVVVNLLIR